MSRGVFPCGCFICTAVFLLCSSHSRWDLSLDGVVWCDFSERVRERLGGVYGWWGFSRVSKILLGNYASHSGGGF